MTPDSAPSDSATADSATASTQGWWRQPFSVFQTNLQEIDALLNVEQILDFIEDYGSDTWLINTGGIVSFYPTDLPFQTRNPFLERRSSHDLIGDAVEAAHRRGIKIISRMDFSKVSAKIAGEHPEWLYVSPIGRPQVYNTLFTACPSADYYQHRSLDILDEVIDRYPVDGFFFNWFGFSERDYSRVYHGVCHCPTCQESFAAFSGGQELPDNSESATYPQWLQFSSGVVKTLGTKIADHITERRPDAALVLRRGAPIAYHEANNAFGRELWHHWTSESVSAHLTGLPEISLMVNSVSFVDMPYRMAGEQPEHFDQYLIQGIARGGNPSTYIMGAPGRIPYANLPHSKKITQFHRAHRDLYAQLRPAATVALARPDQLRSASPGYAESVEEFRGLYTALQEKHIPFDVISAELITKMADEQNLDRYSVIILPDLGSLGAPTGAALDRFVRAGGHVVLTGSSGTTENGGIELSTSPALMRIGQPLADQELWSTYVTDVDQPRIDEYVYAPMVIGVFGSYARYVWQPGVTKIGHLLPQAPFGPPEKCYGHTASADPDVVRLHTGQGGVTVIPWTIGRTYREFGTTQVRDHFLEVIAPLTGQQVFADLPEQVELILSGDEAGLVMHLINQSGARRKSFGPHLPVTGAKLRIPGRAGASVQLLVSDAQPQLTADGDGLVIELPPLELFEVVRVSQA